MFVKLIFSSFDTLCLLLYVVFTDIKFAFEFLILQNSSKQLFHFVIHSRLSILFTARIHGMNTNIILTHTQNTLNTKNLLTMLLQKHKHHVIWFFLSKIIIYVNIYNLYIYIYIYIVFNKIKPCIDDLQQI